MNKLIIIVLVSSVVLALYFVTLKKSSFSNLQILNTPYQKIDSSLSQTFEGLLPCADCGGLKTKLTLTKNSQYSAEGTYTLFETYLGKADKPYITKGNWTTIKGIADNPKQIIYQLMAPEEGQPVNYLLVNSNTLELVDQNYEKIDSPFKLTLTLKK